ncbi:Alpha/Beta hydrolase protein [Phaeosphaeria sp. MPI-PUGE-AT-0046c]|nr:Alpha/Beta hydrolase protein [Phaeosphaeria sp. MPI-PUGE-AT-0046c]
MANHNESDCVNWRHKDADGNHLPRPQYHPTIAQHIDSTQPLPHLRESTLETKRCRDSDSVSKIEFGLRDLPVLRFSRRVYENDGGGPYVSYTVFTPKNSTISGTLRPCIFYIHSGGPTRGHSLHSIEQAVRYVFELNCICVSVDYRLAPENPYPAAVSDCYNVLRDITEHKSFSDQQLSFSIDLANTCILSGMGGAAIAVGLSAKAARNAISIKGMLLFSPMLDFRLLGVSAAQFAKGGYYDAQQIGYAWSLYLNGTYDNISRNHHNLNKYREENPGRRDDLGNLPATFIEVGSCETHRSEAVRFAEQMWRCGGDYELHVWAGGSASFVRVFPKLQISKSAIEARRKWLERILCGVV